MGVFILSLLSLFLLITYFQQDVFLIPSTGFEEKDFMNGLTDEYVQSVKKSVNNGKTLEEEIKLYKEKYA